MLTIYDINSPHALVRPPSMQALLVDRIKLKVNKMHTEWVEVVHNIHTYKYNNPIHNSIGMPQLV